MDENQTKQKKGERVNKEEYKRKLEESLEWKEIDKKTCKTIWKDQEASFSGSRT